MRLFTRVLLSVCALLMMLPGAAGAQDGGENVLAFGVPVQGRIDDGSWSARYTFEAEAGQVIRAAVQGTPETPESEFDLTLALAGPGGDEIAYNDDGPEGNDPLIGPVALETPGTYALTVARFGGESGSSRGTFTLTVEAIDAQVIGAGESVEAEGESVTVLLRAARGGRYRVEVEGAAGASLSAIIEGGGRQMAAAEGEGRAVVRFFAPDEPGLYAVRVQSRPAGRVAVRLSDVQMTPLVVDGAVQASAAEGHAEFFGFEAEANRIYRIVARPLTGGLNLDMEVFGPGNRRVGLAVGSPDAAVDPLIPVEAGSYALRIVPRGGTGGDFEVAVFPNDLMPLPPGQPLEGAIDETGRAVHFALDVTETALYKIEALSFAEGLSLSLDVYAPDGTRIAGMEGDPDAVLDSMALIETGRYVIRMKPTEGVGGNIRVALSEVVLAPLAVGQAAQGMIDVTQSPVDYRFESEPGAFYSITARPESEALALALEIYDADDLLVGRTNDPANPSINPFPAREGGFYRVRVLPLSADVTGNFEIAVEALDIVPVTLEDPVTGALEDSVPQVSYFFAADAHYAYDFALSAVAPAESLSSELDPMLSILTLDGLLLAANDDGGEGRDALVESFIFPWSGVYIMQVGRYAGAGTFTLEVSGEEMPLLLPGEIRQAQTREDGAALFLFEAESGQAVILSVRQSRETAATRPALRAAVRYRDETLFEAAGSGLSEIATSLALPYDGLYVVAVDAETPGTGFEIGIEMP